MPVRFPCTAIFSMVPPQVCSTSSRCAAMARTSKGDVMSGRLEYAGSTTVARFPLLTVTSFVLLLSLDKEVRELLQRLGLVAEGGESAFAASDERLCLDQ